MNNENLQTKDINKKAVVVLPTYNEKDNIEKILPEIFKQQKYIEDFELSVLVVDDSSPDGTAQLVETLTETYSKLYLIEGKKKGLGKAYIKGFLYAMQVLHADVVLEMDADFSHNPDLIPSFLEEIKKGSDFVIGSRYIRGGSIPRDWSMLRKANSKWGNIFARQVAGIRGVKDCTSGYRAIKTSLLKEIDLNRVGAKGYSFQMNLLSQVEKRCVIITEIPLNFVDRTHGSSKLRHADIIEFIINAFYIRVPLLKIIATILPLMIISIILWEFIVLLRFRNYFVHFSLTTVILAYSLIMIAQGIFNLFLLLYAWEDTDRIEKDTPSSSYHQPRYSFSILIPARHEVQVIEDTIKAASQLRYPEELKEVLIICRNDDPKTIEKASYAIEKTGKHNIKIVTFNDSPINKPHSLNIGLHYATKDIVAVFDAEDQPHKDILKIINDVFIKRKADIIQSGVQLMNFRSSWFSALNVLEYFFWFKSSLHFFAAKNTVPLGGNTVFFKRYWLERIHGWDERCLTEDADIGIRLSAMGADIEVVYNEKHATQEETPASIGEFIRQRTRWNQGFIQVIAKGDWLRLPSFNQKLLAVYILLLPLLQSLFIILSPISLAIAILLKLPFLVAFLSIIPLLLLFLQLMTYNVGLYEFTKHHKLRFPLLMPLKILISFYPYQVMLGFSAARAIVRFSFKKNAWEKTLHINAHRNMALAEAIDV